VRGLYAIVDVDVLGRAGIEPVDFAQQVLRVRPTALQLRAKSLEARDMLALLERLQALSGALHVPFFCNDRIDLALIAGCDGVHVGQSDPAPAAVRRLAPALALGVSTHTLDQLDHALAERPAYVAFGPVYSTTSKREPDPVVGLEALREAGDRCRRAGVPLVAIGGITLERASEIRAAADAGAVISALLPGSQTTIEARALALHRALGAQ
jgi:thiamine-phosphate pyrophosphorylase